MRLLDTAASKSSHARRPSWSRLLPGLISLLLVACSEPGPALSPLGDDAVIVAFGDSLTFGTGARREQSYPAVLADKIDREVVNAGVPGELSAAGLARLPSVLDRHLPALLILCHGGNDLLRKRNLQRAEANLEAMIKLAREREIEVMLLGVPQPGLWLTTAELYNSAAETTNTLIETTAIASILGQAALKSDAVHPNAAGYRALADAVVELLHTAGAL